MLPEYGCKQAYAAEKGDRHSQNMIRLISAPWRAISSRRY
jgi:hypothetical protein